MRRMGCRRFVSVELNDRLSMCVWLTAIRPFQRRGEGTACKLSVHTRDHEATSNNVD